MNELLQYIHSLAAFSTESWELLQPALTQQTFSKNKLLFFPYNPEVVQATSGRVTGVLSKTERNKPADHGTVVYINASPDLQLVVDKVEKAGGKVIVPRVEIPAGFIAIVTDSEGNKVGLHAEK